MPLVQPRHVLSGLIVRDAMRRQVVGLPAAATIDQGIRHLLKFKVNALLIRGGGERPLGVVSKTDLIGAYYAGLSPAERLEAVMTGPPLACCPDDELEAALERMRRHGVHRLYVRGAEAAAIAGTLSVTDVVALLYRICRDCPKSRRRRPGAGDAGGGQEMTVREAMTAHVVAFPEDAGLDRVIEGLTAHRFGAVLVRGGRGEARGVISKTDLVRAYRRGVPLSTAAGAVMSAPVAVFDQGAPLFEAIRAMFVKDVQRLFIHAGDPAAVVGVLALTDAARVRSGTCRACVASRILTAPAGPGS
jgi:CBS domain-containing protein